MKNNYYIILIIAAMCCANFILAQDWVQVSSLPSSFQTHHSFGFALGGKGYLVTGASGPQQTPVANFYEYDPVTDEWTALNDFPTSRSFGIGTTMNDKAYFGFGFDGSNDRNDLWEYDPLTGNWQSLASCPCTRRLHPAMVATNGKIYVGLGNDFSGNLNDWWEYDLATNSWSQKTDFPGYKRHHPFQFSIGDIVYVGFGHGNTSISKEWYSYDPATDTWLQVADLPAEGRVAGTQFGYNGKGYVLSGEGDNHGPMPTGEFWEYDPLLDSWRALPPHPGAARWAPSSFVLNDEVYIINGMVRPNTGSSYIAEVYKFDLDSTEVDTTIQTSIRDVLSTAGLNIYPNPTTGIFTIEMDGANLVDVKIFNAIGKDLSSEVLFDPQGDKVLVDISILNSGVYYLHTKSGVSKVFKR